MEHRYKRSKSEPDILGACATVKSVVGIATARLGMDPLL